VVEGRRGGGLGVVEGWVWWRVGGEGESWAWWRVGSWMRVRCGEWRVEHHFDKHKMRSDERALRNKRWNHCSRG
jgi:hypothetical protein